MIARARPRRRQAPDTDPLEPAALDAEALVLLGPDPVLDDAGDLVAVPGDDPQVRVQFGLAEGKADALLGISRRPSGPEGLELGVQDPASVVLGDRPELEPVGQRGVRDVVERRPAHHEAVAHRLEAGRSRSARWAVSCSSAPPAIATSTPRVLDGRPLAGTLHRPAEERRPSPRRRTSGRTAPPSRSRADRQDDTLDRGHAHEPSSSSASTTSRAGSSRPGPRSSGRCSPSGSAGRRHGGWPPVDPGQRP